MIFHSLTFGLFFSVIFAVYWRLNFKWQNRLLLFASAFFYGWWDWRFLGLIGLTVTVDFFVCRGLELFQEARIRKLLLSISLMVDLGMLFVFKYLSFATGELIGLMGVFGVELEAPQWIRQIVLPIGVSFYTFQTLSYVLDVFWGRAKAVQRWCDYALYCSFFPQLLAGPIERASHFMPQLLEPRQRLDADDLAESAYHLVVGLFKKVVIADNMAIVVNHIFSLESDELSGLEVFVGAYAFAFQIYGDFSGYSSIAQGLARLLGIRLSWNFRSPYLATSPQVFWQRWHITLSTWLRDYLFMPMMRARWIKGFAKICVVTLLVQLISGVWHGANWTFVFWGLLHGGYLCIQVLLSRMRWWKEPPANASLLLRLPWILTTFHLMCVGMILFRAESIGHALEMFGALGAQFWEVTPVVIYGCSLMVLLVVPLLIFELWSERKGDSLAILKSSWIAQCLFFGALAIAIWFLPAETTNEFIYFQF